MEKFYIVTNADFLNEIKDYNMMTMMTVIQS